MYMLGFTWTLVQYKWMFSNFWEMCHSAFSLCEPPPQLIFSYWKYAVFDFHWINKVRHSLVSASIFFECSWWDCELIEEEPSKLVLYIYLNFGNWVVKFLVPHSTPISRSYAGELHDLWLPQSPRLHRTNIVKSYHFISCFVQCSVNNYSSCTCSLSWIF